MSKRGPLTYRETQLLAFLEVWFRSNWKHPPMKLMSHAINNKGDACVHYVLKGLGNKGFLSWQPCRIKTILLTSGVSGGEQHQAETGVHHENP